MAKDSPAALLIDEDGNIITLDDGAAIGSAEGIIIAGKDGATARFIRVDDSGSLRVDPVGTTTQPVSASSLPLPTGAATEATLSDLLDQAQGSGSVATLVDGDCHAITVQKFEKNTDNLGNHHLFVWEPDVQDWLKKIHRVLVRVEFMLAQATEVDGEYDDD